MQFFLRTTTLIFFVCKNKVHIVGESVFWSFICNISIVFHGTFSGLDGTINIHHTIYMDYMLVICLNIISIVLQIFISILHDALQMAKLLHKPFQVFFHHQNHFQVIKCVWFVNTEACSVHTISTTLSSLLKKIERLKSNYITFYLVLPRILEYKITGEKSFVDISE